MRLDPFIKFSRDIQTESGNNANAGCIRGLHTYRKQVAFKRRNPQESKVSWKKILCYDHYLLRLFSYKSWKWRLVQYAAVQYAHHTFLYRTRYMNPTRVSTPFFFLLLSKYTVVCKLKYAVTYPVRKLNQKRKAFFNRKIKIEIYFIIELFT